MVILRTDEPEGVLTPARLRAALQLHDRIVAQPGYEDLCA
eukprot:SAG31_NODE_41683_length_275_cov_0.579545_1_plen_39_part_01